MIQNVYKKSKTGIKLFISGGKYPGIVTFDPRDYGTVKWYTWRISPEGYVVACGLPRGRNIYFHRLIMGLPEKRDERIVDHEDRDRLNNRRKNLKVVTHVENNSNASKRKDNKTSVVGVKERDLDVNGDRKYEAQITCNGTRKTKRFSGPNALQEAIKWRQMMAVEFNNTNG